MMQQNRRGFLQATAAGLLAQIGTCGIACDFLTVGIRVGSHF